MSDVEEEDEEERMSEERKKRRGCWTSVLEKDGGEGPKYTTHIFNHGKHLASSSNSQSGALFVVMSAANGYWSGVYGGLRGHPGTFRDGKRRSGTGFDIVRYRLILSERVKRRRRARLHAETTEQKNEKIKPASAVKVSDEEETSRPYDIVEHPADILTRAVSLSGRRSRLRAPSDTPTIFTQTSCFNVASVPRRQSSSSESADRRRDSSQSRPQRYVLLFCHFTDGFIGLTSLITPHNVTRLDSKVGRRSSSLFLNSPSPTEACPRVTVLPISSLQFDSSSHDSSDVIVPRDTAASLRSNRHFCRSQNIRSISMSVALLSDVMRSVDGGTSSEPTETSARRRVQNEII
ncbi:hypothetical protein F2P81_022805 [Scophthalmus maximus]|uniref:Uncharacterized protein n=1 Tax=Scophthalmus maximus TaxID=52904 RepID=A0A6A4S5V3_SCOMX|nr:hypothetical protein F2P81_022805 [Scophthalmus maximus]